MRPESILVGIYTFNSRLGTRITAYKSGSRLSNCAARSNRDIIDSNGLSSLISLISSTSAVDIDRLQQSDHLETDGCFSLANGNACDLPVLLYDLPGGMDPIKSRA